MAKLILAIVITLLFNHSAIAQDDYQLDLGIGAFALSIPDYPGSNEQSNYIVPMPYIYYRDDKVAVDRQGITSSLWQHNNIYFDLSASAGIPAKSKNNRARSGMPDIDWTFGLGTSLKYYWQGDPLAKNTFYSEVFARKVIATDFSSLDNIGWHSGFSTTIERDSSVLGYAAKWSTKININVNSDKYLDYYYGVQSQYQTSQRNTFASRSGYAGADISSGVMIKLPSFWVGGFVKYYSFKHSEQIHSPLLTDNQGWAVGIGLLWIFYNNKESL